MEGAIGSTEMTVSLHLVPVDEDSQASTTAGDYVKYYLL